MHPCRLRTSVAWLLAAALALLAAPSARAHCDTPEGPVIPAVHKALATGELTPALRWIKPEHEAEVKTAFAKARAARAAGDAAREIADTWFAETFVRLHRAGEGEPFTGLKPAGTDPGAAVKAADQALARGSDEEVVKLVTDAVAAALRQRFARAKAAAAHADDNLDAGRRAVAAYVDFVHFIERTYHLATGHANHDAHAIPTPHAAPAAHDAHAAPAGHPVPPHAPPPPAHHPDHPAPDPH